MKTLLFDADVWQFPLNGRLWDVPTDIVRSGRINVPKLPRMNLVAESIPEIPVNPITLEPTWYYAREDEIEQPSFIEYIATDFAAISMTVGGDRVEVRLFFERNYVDALKRYGQLDDLRNRMELNLILEREGIIKDQLLNGAKFGI